MVWMFASQCSWFTSMCTGLIAYICHAVPCYLWLCIYIYIISKVHNPHLHIVSIWIPYLYIYIYTVQLMDLWWLMCHSMTTNPPFSRPLFFWRAAAPSAATKRCHRCHRDLQFASLYVGDLHPDCGEALLYDTCPIDDFSRPQDWFKGKLKPEAIDFPIKYGLFL